MWTKDMGKPPRDPQGAEDRDEDREDAPPMFGADSDEAPRASRTERRDAGQDALDERQRMLDAMEEHYDFPGEYKIVVIAKVGGGFKTRLIAFLEAHAEEGGYRMHERRSSQGNFVSYHLHIHVVSAEIALERKHAISRLEGVHVLL